MASMLDYSFVKSVGQLEPLDMKVNRSNLPLYRFQTEIMYSNIVSITLFTRVQKYLLRSGDDTDQAPSPA